MKILYVTDLHGDKKKCTVKILEVAIEKGNQSHCKWWGYVTKKM